MLDNGGKVQIIDQSRISHRVFTLLHCGNRRTVVLTLLRTRIRADLCATPLLFSSVSWCVPSSPAFCTSASWLPSPGCVWRGCSCTSCWSTCLRASSHAGNTTTSPGTSPQRWWWASQPPSTTGATARRECESACAKCSSNGFINNNTNTTR